MLVDTHVHLNFNAYKNDAEEVIKRALDSDVWMINVGTKYETSKKAVEIAQNYPQGVYAAIGLHPIHLETRLVKIKMDPEEVAFNAKEEEFDYEKYKDLANLSLGEGGKVVAIGEIGLDYYYKPKTKRKLELFKEKQKEVLSQQLKLAKELNLPIVFHCRMGHQDLIDFLLNNPEVRPGKAVAHGFVGNLEELQKYLDFGYYIGFNGIVFKSIEGIDFEENIKKTPLDKILIETDCPYLTPPISVNQRLNQRESAGTMRNEPIFVKYIAERIAGIKGLNCEEIAKITTENAKKLFKI